MSMKAMVDLHTAQKGEMLVHFLGYIVGFYLALVLALLLLLRPFS